MSDLICVIRVHSFINHALVVPSVCTTETCVLTKGKRLATVKALTDCQCFSLSWDDFQEVLEGFPDVKKDLEKVVQVNADDALV